MIILLTKKEQASFSIVVVVCIFIYSALTYSFTIEESLFRMLSYMPFGMAGIFLFLVIWDQFVTKPRLENAS